MVIKNKHKMFDMIFKIKRFSLPTKKQRFYLIVINIFVCDFISNYLFAIKPSFSFVPVEGIEGANKPILKVEINFFFSGQPFFFGWTMLFLIGIFLI